jgi:hypothetical protein
MRVSTRVVEIKTYQSEVRPEISSEDPRDGEVIAWADAYPVAYRIVSGNRSQPFGKSSCVYLGCLQGRDDVPSVIGRLCTLKGEISKPGIFGFRARFTLEHYQDKGFKGGFFQQWDEKYPRDCLSLDYTPETLPEVLAQFEVWMSKYYRTVRITVNGETVREYPEGVEVGA